MYIFFKNVEENKSPQKEGLGLNRLNLEGLSPSVASEEMFLCYCIFFALVCAFSNGFEFLPASPTAT
jgi:hypothetical protein